METEVVLEGRRYVAEGQAELFYDWADRNMPYISRDKMKEAFSLLFKVEQTDRALRLYDAVVKTYDTNAGRDIFIRLVTKAIKKAVILAGALGGCIYLYRVLMGG